MKTLLTIFLYLLLVQGQSSSAYADISDQSCSFTGSTAQNPPYVPTTGTNKALILFVQFSDDTFGSNPPRHLYRMMEAFVRRIPLPNGLIIEAIYHLGVQT